MKFAKIDEDTCSTTLTMTPVSTSTFVVKSQPASSLLFPPQLLRVPSRLKAMSQLPLSFNNELSLEANTTSTAAYAAVAVKTSALFALVMKPTLMAK